MICKRAISELLFSRHDAIVADLEVGTAALSFALPPTHMWAIPEEALAIYVVCPEETIDLQAVNVSLGRARIHTIPLTVHIAIPAMKDSTDVYLYERCDMVMEILAMRITRILLETTRLSYRGYTLGITGDTCSIRDTSEFFEAEEYQQEMVVFQRTLQCTAQIGVVQPDIFDPAVVAALLQPA